MMWQAERRKHEEREREEREERQRKEQERLHREELRPEAVGCGRACIQGLRGGVFSSRGML